jgi:hypothetical protein
MMAEAASDPDPLDAIADDEPAKLRDERRRVVQWINTNFASSSPDICRYCGRGPQVGDLWTRLYCGDDSGVVHTSCFPAWERAAETAARLALRLDP